MYTSNLNQPPLPSFPFSFFLPPTPFRFSPCVPICGFLLTFPRLLRPYLALLELQLSNFCQVGGTPYPARSSLYFILCPLFFLLMQPPPTIFPYPVTARVFL